MKTVKAKEKTRGIKKFRIRHGEKRYKVRFFEHTLRAQSLSPMAPRWSFTTSHNGENLNLLSHLLTTISVLATYKSSNLKFSISLLAPVLVVPQSNFSYYYHFYLHNLSY